MNKGIQGVTAMRTVMRAALVRIAMGDEPAQKIADDALAAAAPQPAPTEPACQHEWVSADNQYLSNGSVCLKCKTIVPTNTLPSEPAPSEDGRIAAALEWFLHDAVTACSQQEREYFAIIEAALRAYAQQHRDRVVDDAAVARACAVYDAYMLDVHGSGNEADDCGMRAAITAALGANNAD